MSRLFVSGLINIETTLKVEGFPIAYEPVRYPFFGVNSTVAGVGYNISKALLTLGNEARLASLIGQDMAGSVVKQALTRDGIDDALVLPQLARTAQSVILYDRDGKRMINTDLKDVQDQVYPLDRALAAARGCDIAVLCNINFSRAMLQPAREMGLTLAADVHAIHDHDDAYNRDFMAAAHILFLSHERLAMSPAEWAREAMTRFGNDVIVIGLGAQGALLAVRRDDFVGVLPAVTTRPVVSTIGAGDALFVSFLHTYARTRDPYAALRRAMVFASWKIGVSGVAEGFLDAATWDKLCAAHLAEKSPFAGC